MIKCKVCGYEFMPVAIKHYISRDNDYEGLAAAFKKEEAKLYDTFDCPYCGCQVIAQERKRIDTLQESVPFLIDEPVLIDEPGEVNELEEHEGGEGEDYE